MVGIAATQDVSYNLAIDYWADASIEDASTAQPTKIISKKHRIGRTSIVNSARASASYCVPANGKRLAVGDNNRGAI